MRTVLRYTVLLDGREFNGDLEVDRARVNFLSGFMHNTNAELVGKEIVSRKVTIVLSDTKSRICKAVNLSETMGGADILSADGSKAQGHLLIVNVKEMALDFVKSLCTD